MPTISAFENSPPIDRDYAPFAVVWTRADCEKLEANGILDYRYELIEGVILRKMGQNRQHSLSVMRAIAWLLRHFDSDCVQTQSSIHVATSDNVINKPEPDIALLRRPLQNLDTDQPLPNDVQLIIEISDSTLEYDLGSKTRLYARANISEYWIVSLPERRLYTHIQPVNGLYTRAVFSETDTVALFHAPHVRVLVSELLAPVMSTP